MIGEWGPTASVETLRARAALVKTLRSFFDQRGFLEVETPLASHCCATDPYLVAMETAFHLPGSLESERLYLQTSPEYAMKRLLAAGTGSIYQIGKAFRNGESGRWHNPEFTLLEWYELGADDITLMDRMDELLAVTLGYGPMERVTYQTLFKAYCGLDPFRATVADLDACATSFKVHFPRGIHQTDRETRLQLLMGALIEPHLGGDGRACAVYDFPASQGALARLKGPAREVAARVEVYVEGVELGNGFHELTDPIEQRDRFLNDLAVRARQNRGAVPLDERFLAALVQGVPDCAGLALGVDRLVMLATGLPTLADAMSFPVERA